MTLRSVKQNAMQFPAQWTEKSGLFRHIASALPIVRDYIRDPHPISNSTRPFSFQKPTCRHFPWSKYIDPGRSRSPGFHRPAATWWLFRLVWFLNGLHVVEHLLRILPVEAEGRHEGVDAAITVLQSLQEVAVVKFRFAKAAKRRCLPVRASAGPANGVTAGAQLLQHLFAISLLLSPRVGEGTPQETHCQYKQGLASSQSFFCATAARRSVRHSNARRLHTS